MFFRWKPYVPAAERRRKAAQALARFQKKGKAFSPVVIEGTAVAKTFWGKAWCNNMERYSDFSNRLPRGRTYVRNGSVIDLKIAAGEVTGKVMGSSLYTTTVRVAALPKARWQAIGKDCSGTIDSLIELLQGRLSKGVMERICRQETGLFPSPKEIAFDCSCPDWAEMCKHVAAVLYGIGARLDKEPELLFTLRKVDPKDLVAQAAGAVPLAKKGLAAGKVLEDSKLAEVFGIEMADIAVSPSRVKTASAKRKQAKPPTRKKKAAKRSTAAPRGPSMSRRKRRAIA